VKIAAFVAGGDDGDGPDTLELNNPELSWQIWTRMEATGGKHLPYPGALLDQPDWLMQDLFVITGEARRREKEQKRE
jgi:hypothetical protein